MEGSHRSLVASRLLVVMLMLGVTSAVADCSDENAASPPVALQQCNNSTEVHVQGDADGSRQSADLLDWLPVFSLANCRVANPECRRHSQIFVQELRRYSMWALHMMDSSGKLGSGILRGAASQLGDFDQCLEVSAPQHSLRGRYCLLDVDISSAPGGPLEEAVTLAQAGRFIVGSRLNPGHFVPRFTTLAWAVCIPASCSASDVLAAAADALAPLNGSAGLMLQIGAHQISCYDRTSGAARLPVLTVAAVLMLVAVGITVIIATLRDLNNSSQDSKPGSVQRLVQAFSVCRTWNQLTGPLRKDGDIPCIYGLRAVFTAALYVAHKVITLALTPYTNRIHLTKVANAPLSVLLRSSVVYTDSFLLLSGALTAYNQTREVDRSGQIKWARRIAARYIRLTPALLALIAGYAYVMDHLGEGPLWGQVVIRNSEICQYYGWRNLLYIQNFFPFEDMCATHTHQLALDMQLSLLSPLLITLLHAHLLLGAGVLITFSLLSSWLRFVATAKNGLSLIIYHGMPQSQLYKTANHLYSLPIHRATPYIFGVALGYFIKKSGKSLNIPKMSVSFGWLLASILGYYSLLSAWDTASQHFQYDVTNAARYAALAPLAWSTALCWLIVACHYGYAGKLNAVLCSRPMVLFSRISYAVYLTQFAVFFYNVGTIRSSLVFSIKSSFNLEEMAVVIIISIFSTLLFDLPMQEVKGILLQSGQKSQETASSSNKCQ